MLQGLALYPEVASGRSRWGMEGFDRIRNAVSEEEVLSQGRHDLQGPTTNPSLKSLVSVQEMDLVEAKLTRRGRH